MHALFCGRFRGWAAIHDVQIVRSCGVQSYAEDLDVPGVGCLSYEAMFEWHLGKISSCQATMAEAISLARELNDMHGLALALFYAAVLSYLLRDPAEVERCASELIELSTRQGFMVWLAGGQVLREWARRTSGDTAEGISGMEDGIRNYRATGSILVLPFLLALKAEALHLADRTCEALEAIREAEALVERFEERWFFAELHRLRGVFLTAMGADETKIEASFCEAISTAKQQKSISLGQRAEATYAEYCRQKASGFGGHGFRLPLS
jgi:predicted ATPase